MKDVAQRFKAAEPAWVFRRWVSPVGQAAGRHDSRADPADTDERKYNSIVGKWRQAEFVKCPNHEPDTQHSGEERRDQRNQRHLDSIVRNHFLSVFQGFVGSGG